MVVAGLYFIREGRRPLCVDLFEAGLPDAFDGF